MTNPDAGAFFVRDGDGFRATELTRGPWDRHHQHAGPPTALLGGLIESLAAGSPRQIARVTFDILRPVPIDLLHVSAEVVRPGRSVDLVEGRLSADGEEVMQARAWRIRTAPDETPSVGQQPPPRGPDAGTWLPFFEVPWDVGYHTAMEWRFLHGGFREPGPATIWLRTRVPIVAGEEPSPLQRVLVAADSGNGISAALDPAQYLFVNTDLSVHLHRLPEGEWVGMEAATTIEPYGVGIADTRLFDRMASLGRCVQSLIVSERPPGG